MFLPMFLNFNTYFKICTLCSFKSCYVYNAVLTLFNFFLFKNSCLICCLCITLSHFVDCIDFRREQKDITIFIFFIKILDWLRKISYVSFSKYYAIFLAPKVLGNEPQCFVFYFDSFLLDLTVFLSTWNGKLC